MAENILSKLMGVGEGERKEITYEQYKEILTNQVDYHKEHYKEINEKIYTCNPSEVMVYAQYAAMTLKEMSDMANEVTQAELVKERGKFYIAEDAVFFEQYSPVELAIEKTFKKEQVDNAESMTI